MRSKKAIIEAQLTWVFILIVGVVILLFFIGIAQKQREISDMKASVELLQRLDVILTGAEAASGTSALISVPRMDIEMDCTNFYLGSAKKPIKTRVIFSPDLIKGRQLVMYNLDWSDPYRITNFLYLTSPEVRYIFVGGTDAYDLDKSLPEYMNKEVSSTYNPTMRNKNNYKVKFVFFNDMPAESKIPTRLKGEITAINIKATTIEFYEIENKEWKKIGTDPAHYGIESKIGAVFAENAEMYECNIKKADKKKEIVNDIYQQRVTELLNSNLLDMTCGSLLPNNLAGLSAEAINLRNDRLQIQGCPTIY